MERIEDLKQYIENVGPLKVDVDWDTVSRSRFEYNFVLNSTGQHILNELSKANSHVYIIEVSLGAHESKRDGLGIRVVKELVHQGTSFLPDRYRGKSTWLRFEDLQSFGFVTKLIDVGGF